MGKKDRCLLWLLCVFLVHTTILLLTCAFFAGPNPFFCACTIAVSLLLLVVVIGMRRGDADRRGNSGQRRGQAREHVPPLLLLLPAICFIIFDQRFQAFWAS